MYYHPRHMLLFVEEAKEVHRLMFLIHGPVPESVQAQGGGGPQSRLLHSKRGRSLERSQLGTPGAGASRTPGSAGGGIPTHQPPQESPGSDPPGGGEAAVMAAPEAHRTLAPGEPAPHGGTPIGPKFGDYRRCPIQVAQDAMELDDWADRTGAGQGKEAPQYKGESTETLRVEATSSEAEDGPARRYGPSGSQREPTPEPLASEVL